MQAIAATLPELGPPAAEEWKGWINEDLLGRSLNATERAAPSQGVSYAPDSASISSTTAGAPSLGRSFSVGRWWTWDREFATSARQTPPD